MLYVLCLFFIMVFCIGSIIYMQQLGGSVMILVPVLIFLVISLLLILRLLPKWFVRRGTVETGPYSLKQLAQLLRTNQLDVHSQIRKRWSKEFGPFTLLIIPAPRVFAGFVGLILGTPIAFGIAFYLKAEIKEGTHMPAEWILHKPNISDFENWLSIHFTGSDKLARFGDWVRRFTSLGTSIASLAPNFGIQALAKGSEWFAGELGTLGSQAMASIHDRIDVIRYSAIGGGIVCAIIFALLAQESYVLKRGIFVNNAQTSNEQNEEQKYRFSCYKCNKLLTINRIHLGRKVRCNGCGAVVTSPQGLG
ncbi:MAG: hypothetical protein U0796_17705 [Gemmatales bacterium]